MALAPYSPHEQNPIESWEELVNAETSFGDHDEWAFRGQNTSCFPASSLERLCKNLDITGRDIVDLEVKLIREFARSYHLYTGYTPPQKGHTLEWLSLLRHYGAPTRLIDFTYSFFIATYFALEKADACPVVWAVNTTQLGRNAEAHIKKKIPNGSKLLKDYGVKKDEQPFRAIFMRNSRCPFVYLANPLRLNQRLTIQQGMFLAPGDVTTTFEENVRATPNYRTHLIQVVLDPGCRQEVLRKLHRMGINRATLFPDLEGFAKSLHTKSLILRRLPPQGVKMLKEI